MPLLMGILNVTPDSFSDGAQFATPKAAIARAMMMAAQGADIIDVGGESTRPNHQTVPLEQELARVIPVIQALVKQGLCVSIDSQKPQVMRAALDAGASIINDVNALHDTQALAVALDSDCGLVVMDGFSASDQALKQAGSPLLNRLAMRHRALIAAGIAPQRLMLDPGIGFDKDLADNLACLHAITALSSIAPVVFGASRKSMLGAITAQSVHQRLAASIAIALLAAQRGAAVLRVHDVQATADALKVWRAVDGAAG